MRVIQNSILILLLFTLDSFSQENDFQVWSAISANDKFTYKTDFYLKHGVRFRENASLLSKVYTEIKFKYKYNKRFAFSLGFRDINEWNREIIREQKNRYFADVHFRKKHKRFLINFRNRFQKQGKLSNYNNILRQSISFSYNIKKNKIDPSFTTEFFYKDLNFSLSNINKIRYTFSLSYPINKDLDLDIAYRLQQQLNVVNPETFYIFEGKLSYDL